MSLGQCDKVARIYTSLLVYTSIWGKILVFYSYFCDLLVFLWYRAHSTCCELFDPVKSYGNDSAILKQSKYMLLNFEPHRCTLNLHQKNCADLRTFVVKMSRVEFTCFFKTKTLILLVFLLVFCSHFCWKSARI